MQLNYREDNNIFVESKTMKRREFCQLLSASSLVLATPKGVNQAFAATPDHFLVMVGAHGGWDPTISIDPKGDILYDATRGMINHYAVSDIKKVGGINVAPSMATIATPLPTSNTPTLAAGDKDKFVNFFTKYQNWLVLNGINTQTTNHNSGQSGVWSGNLTENDFPCLAALYAGCKMPELPMSFSDFGYYSVTKDVVSKVMPGNTNLINGLASPNQLNGTPYYDQEIFDDIEKARKERITRLKAEATLPEKQYQLGAIFSAEENLVDLKKFQNFLSPTLPNTSPYRNNPLARQAQIACAAFAAGIGISANLTMGGFDTHGNHDIDQYNAQLRLFEGVDFLIQEATAKGIIDKMTIIVGSDFGRTPYYNTGNGKDHWNHTSMMMMGPGIRGNRVVGASDKQVKSLKLDPVTLQVSSAASAVILDYETVQASLRQHLGIDQHAFSKKFNIKRKTLELFI